MIEQIKQLFSQQSMFKQVWQAHQLFLQRNVQAMPSQNSRSSCTTVAGLTVQFNVIKNLPSRQFSRQSFEKWEVYPFDMLRRDRVSHKEASRGFIKLSSHRLELFACKRRFDIRLRSVHCIQSQRGSSSIQLGCSTGIQRTAMV